MIPRSHIESSARGSAGLLSLFWVLLFSIVASCVIAPALYHVFRDTLGGWPYSRIFDRVILVVLVVTFLVARWLHLAGLPSVSLKLSPDRTSWKELAIGFIVAIIPAAIGCWLLVAGGEFVLSAKRSIVETILLRVVPSMVIVAVLEELVFRGIIFRSLRAHRSFLLAAILTSAMYAVVHFIVPQRGWNFDTWSLGVGFEYLFVILGNIFLPGVLTGVAALFLVGMILTYSVERTGRFALAIGMHAAWIAVMKLTGYFATIQADTAMPAALGRRYFLLTQFEMYAALIVTGCLVYAYCRKMYGNVSS